MSPRATRGALHWGGGWQGRVDPSAVLVPGGDGMQGRVPERRHAHTLHVLRLLPRADRLLPLP